MYYSAADVDDDGGGGDDGIAQVISQFSFISFSIFFFALFCGLTLRCDMNKAMKSAFFAARKKKFY